MPARRRFEGRSVVVTGAGGGIGRALARRFAGAGSRVALLDREPGGIGALTDELEAAGVETLARVCDVADLGQCEGALAAVVERFGGIDVLVANAGITHRSPFAETDVAVYRRVMDVNFFGALHCTRAALPALLRGRGLVIVISSVAGLAPLLGRSGYCASKHALQGFFGTLRCELAPRGVEVMLVCPGFTATAIERDALGADGAPAGRPQTRLGRQATPEAVADAVYQAARRRRRLLVLSATGHAAHRLAQLAPGLYERAMTRLFRAELDPGGSGSQAGTDSPRP